MLTETYRCLAASLPGRTMQDLRKNTYARGHTHFTLDAASGNIYARGYQVMFVDVDTGTVTAWNSKWRKVRNFRALCMTTTHNGPCVVCE